MRRIKQEQYFPIIIAGHLILWLIDLLLYKGNYEFSAQHIAGEVFSSWVVTVFAANFLMATRARWVENIFGGLDKMYMIHRRAGIIAVVLLILHFIVVPKYPVFSIGKPLGFISLILILIGAVLSAAPIFKRKFKYNKWLNIHKLMGLFYILGIAHAVNVPSLTSELPIVRTYVLIMSLIGIIAWFYKAFLYNLLNKKSNYTITAIKRFKDDTMEILLKPDKKKISYKAGQFAIVTFPSINREMHPFTISSHPSDENIRFTIKALGDYTADLQNSLKEGAKAKLQAPFGHFTMEKSKHKKQLWLAGGIGITPFLSLLKDTKKDNNITLVWSVKSADQAHYKNEIENTVSANSKLNFILWDTDSKSFFAIDKLYNTENIKNHSIYICGPEVMRESYIKQLLQKGVSLKDIHFEEFSFR